MEYHAVANLVAAEASVYMDNCVQLAAAKHASDLSIAEKLWKLSEKIVGQEFEL